MNPHCWLRLRAHRWRPQQAAPFTVYSGRDMRPTSYETAVVYVCAECGRARVRTLEGSWTLEDLT